MAQARAKILVAMSGGVDSSVAAALLVRAGHEVIGCFMRLGSPDEPGPELERAEACATGPDAGGGTAARRSRGCCSVGDAADARAVAAELGIPLYVCNFRREFDRVIDYFVDEYAAGRTPNPCVRCNDWLKFGKLHDHSARLGCDLIASGHYARIAGEDGDGETEPRGAGRGAEFRLLRARDPAKDQSYVLFGLPRAQLARTRFPIGEFPKSEVRDLARRFGLPVFDKPDSQEICFVPDDDYAGLVERRRPALAGVGPLVDESGTIVGAHRGQHRFTIGQRRGIGTALGHPVYVVARDAATNTVTLGGREALLAGGCTVHRANWLGDAGRFAEWAPCLAKYRYNTPAAPARARLLADSPTRDRFEVRFDEAQAAVAPGQALVLYDAAEPAWVLGGGWIDQARSR